MKPEELLSQDTIVAISTPLGEGGFGTVRLSGKEAVKIAENIFKPKNIDLKISNTSSHTVHYGWISKNGAKIDEVLLSIYLSPRTYTREDVVEISGHGGIVPLRQILELCMEKGARLAQPGEFTKRAFLNGRIDLSQAEAVCDLIRAKTSSSAKAALCNIHGSFSKEIKKIQKEITEVIAKIEAGLNFPEYINCVSQKEFIASIEKIESPLCKFLETSDFGKILREGLRVSIVGKPNAGKSSLLNYLLGEDRAIVTHLPGTTRDVIENMANINGLPVILSDTAGIRDTRELIESLGIEKSKENLETADLVFIVVDCSVPFGKEDNLIRDLCSDKKKIIIANKTDLPLLAFSIIDFTIFI